MNRSILILWLILVTISGCTVYREYPIDVYKPGEISVSPELVNAAVVYRNFKYSVDTLQNYYKDDYRLKKIRTSTEETDSIQVVTCLNELARNLKEKNSFNRVEILPYNVFKRHTGDKLPPLNFDIIKKLSETTQSDILISLETYSSFYSEYSANYDVAESNEVITAVVWAVYDAVNEKLIERKAMIDTIFWNGYDENGNYHKDYRFPPREDAIKIAARMAGENYAKRFYASWQTVNRMYSVPPLPDFSEAAHWVEEGKWDNAIKLWEKYAADKNGKLAINARYNLALGYEMKDDLETASKWAVAALNLAMTYRSKEDLKMIMLYQKILEQRKKDLKRLTQD